jgi:hypothetical protein
MIHIKTKNISFLKTYYLLKEKGYNVTFFLELFDPSLEDADPSDEEHLSHEQKQRIIIECTQNPWYFIRECVAIPTSGKAKYELNLGNLAFTWASLNHLSSFLVLPRQTGKTFGACVVILWITYFSGYNTECMLYAQSDHNLDNNMGRIRALRQNLPSYLNFHDKKKDRDGAKVIQFTALGNKIMRQAPKKSESDADSVGRGFSTPIAWYDEFAFIPRIQIQFQASVLAQSTVAKVAQKNNLPNCVMITTTAAFLNSGDGKFAYDFFNDCLEFDESMYSMARSDIIKLMTNNAKRSFLKIEYPYWELGKGDDYFNTQSKELGYVKDSVDREILCKWKDVDTEHPLGQETIALLDGCVHKPVKVIVINDIFRVKLYKDPNTLKWDVPYIIAGDCSNNVGADYSSLVAVDPRNYEVVAVVRTNMYSTMYFARLIVTLMRKYFFKSILVLERNLNGATILDRVVEIDWMLQGRIYASADKPDIMGITTVSRSRKLLYNQILKMSIDDSYNLLHDKVIIDEIKGLIKTRTGRIDHRPGGHDDTLISYLFARWFLLFGEKIDRYINPMTIGVFSDVKGTNEMETQKRKEGIQRELMKKEREEAASIRRMFQPSYNDGFTGFFPQELPGLKEQRDYIRNGGRAGENIIGGAGRHKNPDSLIADVFNKLTKNRFDPLGDNRNDSTLFEYEEDEKDGETEQTDSVDEDDDLYYRNPKEIQFKKKPVRNTSQLEREVLSSNADDASELVDFMRQFR